VVPGAGLTAAAAGVVRGQLVNTSVAAWVRFLADLALICIAVVLVLSASGAVNLH
jgi:hypothetical protein